MKDGDNLSNDLDVAKSCNPHIHSFVLKLADLQEAFNRSYKASAKATAGTTGDPHALLAMLLDNQSRPSYRPSPEVAQVLWMYLQIAQRVSAAMCSSLGVKKCTETLTSGADAASATPACR